MRLEEVVGAIPRGQEYGGVVLDWPDLSRLPPKVPVVVSRWTGAAWEVVQEPAA